MGSAGESPTTETQGVGSAGESPTTETQGVGSAGESPTTEPQGVGSAGESPTTEPQGVGSAGEAPTTETQGVGSAGESPTTETQGVGSAGESPSSKSQQCTVLVSETCLQVGYPILTCFFLTVQEMMKMLQDMKKMFEIHFKARHEVESALLALVKALEPISDISRQKYGEAYY